MASERSEFIRPSLRCAEVKSLLSGVPYSTAGELQSRRILAKRSIQTEDQIGGKSAWSISAAFGNLQDPYRYSVICQPENRRQRDKLPSLPRFTGDLKSGIRLLRRFGSSITSHHITSQTESRQELASAERHTAVSSTRVGPTCLHLRSSLST
ncbi:hypothetical protein BJX70DRAFT_292059 [Aspergillus crustosus]